MFDIGFAASTVASEAMMTAVRHDNRSFRAVYPLWSLIQTVVSDSTNVTIFSAGFKHGLLRYRCSLLNEKIGAYMGRQRKVRVVRLGIL